MDNTIYVVFSATPTKMGRLIRGATRNRYNHVSLSFDRDIRKMFSFARLHRAVPLYGGLVVESILRYQSFAGAARVKICRIPATSDQMDLLRSDMERLWLHREEYIYNTLAAVASLVCLRPAISKAYTCVTFVQDILCRHQLAGATRWDRPTVRALERQLASFVIYEGPAPDIAPGETWGEDVYPAETTTRYAFYTTARHFGRLAKRALAEVL